MRWLFGFLCMVLCAACSTVPDRPSYPDPDVENPGLIVIAQPLPAPPPAPRVQTPPPTPTEPPPEPVIEAPAPSGFAALPFWNSHDPRPALTAFVRGCETWTQINPDDLLNPNLPQYGRYKDWTSTCQSAAVLQSVDPSRIDARNFFEGWFAPVNLTTPTLSLIHI